MQRHGGKNYFSLHWCFSFSIRDSDSSISTSLAPPAPPQKKSSATCIMDCTLVLSSLILFAKCDLFHAN